MLKIILTNLCFIMACQLCYSQSVSGIVTNSDTDKPLSGVSILLKDFKQGTVSLEDGSYMLRLPRKGNFTLIYSYLGYSPVEKQIYCDGSPVILNISLSEVNEKLEAVEIKGTITKPVRHNGDVLFTGSELTTKGIEVMGSAAYSSVYSALGIMPGIQVECNDAYGLSEKTVRIRGVNSYFSGMTLEGFPNYGIMPIGARDNIYDMENMQSIALYKGATPADLGSATGNKGGVIELKFRRPQENMGLQVDQSIGSDRFTRSFFRFDLGRLKTGTRIFASFSNSNANKWKGEGKMGPRHNATFGLSQQLGNKTDIEIFANINHANRHDYRPLTYEQTRNPGENSSIHYNSQLSGDPNQDIYYFDYNAGEYTNIDLMGSLNYKVNEVLTFFLKAYLSTEDADYYESVRRGPNAFVFNRQRDINRQGLIPEINSTIGSLTLAFGYWMEFSDNKAYVYSSQITENGLQDIGYSYYTKNMDRSQIHSPYIKAAYEKNRFSMQGGLKYFYFSDPESERYPSISPTELASEPDEGLHTDQMIHAAFLPTLGLGYQISSRIQLYINYGRNYMRPYMYSPIISLYIKNQEAFEEANMNLQDIFDLWHMETSDNIDLGLRFNTPKYSLNPSIFVAKHYNVLASAYNAEVGLDFYQNVGSLTAYGTDIEFYFSPFKLVTILLNPTYTSMSYDKNLERKSDSTTIITPLKGNQSPATPMFSVKTGYIFSLKDFEFTGIIKYTGKRYGDATNIEEIKAYTLVDLSMSYEFEKFWHISKLKFGIELKNALNKKYIGAINAFDDSTQGSASYFAGAPRSFVTKVSLRF